MLVDGGATNVTTYFAMRKTADGTDATGLTIADMDLQYVRSGALPSAKVDAVALAAANTAHTDNRAIEIDATDQPGLYRVDWPDAAFAAGVREVILTVKVATAFTEHKSIEIDATLKPTTAGRTLTVEADGMAHADLLEWRGIQPLSLTSNRVQTSVRDMQANVITAASIAAAAMNGKGDWNVGKTGYSLTQSFPTNFSAMGIETDGHVHGDLKQWLGVAPSALAAGSVLSDIRALQGETGASNRLSRFFLGGQHSTAQGGTANTITLNSGADANDDFFKDCIIILSNNTGKRQYRLIIAYNGTTKVATITPNWIVNPDATTEYTIAPIGLSDVASWGSVVPNALVSGRVDASAGALASNVITAASIAASALDGKGDWNIGKTGYSVSTLAANVITATSIAAAALTAVKFGSGAIDAAALATDAVNEIADGVRSRQMTEGYAADTVAPTVEQILFMIWSYIHDFGIAGTTKTSRNLGNGTAMTHTLDDGTNPTDMTRAT